MVEDIVLINKSTGDKLELSMTDTPNYILWNVDWGTVESSASTHRYYKQIGESVSNVAIGTRDVVIYGWIVATTENEMTNLKKYLNSFVNPLQTLELQYKGYSIDFVPEKSLGYSKEWDENNDVMVKFEISGVAYDPLFRTSTEARVDAVDTDAKWVFPWAIPSDGFIFGIRQESLFFSVENDGDVPIGMRFILKANGALTNPSLINVRTGEFFKINKELEAGEEVEVSTIIGSKSVAGRLTSGAQIEHFDYFKYRDLSSTWLQLEIGDNEFKFDADENPNNLDVFVYFSPKFMEVEQCY